MPEPSSSNTRKSHPHESHRNSSTAAGQPHVQPYRQDPAHAHTTPAVLSEREVIRASAGTGKTYRLSSRYIALLMAGVPAEQILATTFTRKAAGEIQERVLLRLAKAALCDRECRQLAESIEVPELTRDQCQAGFDHLIRHLHRMRVSTLDSFFVQLARCYSLELGLPTRWQVFDSATEQAIREQAVEHLMQEEQGRHAQSLLHLLTKGESIRGVGDLLRSTVNELYDQYLDSTRDAWHRIQPPAAGHELEETIDLLSSFELNGRLAKARDKDLEFARRQAWDDLLRVGLTSRVLDGSCEYYRQPLDPELVRLYRQLLDHARGYYLARLARQTESAYALLDGYHGCYRALQQSRRGLRFSDITWSLAHNLDGSAAGISFRLDSRIEHLLLDEFQDTSPVQWRVLRPFARHVTARDTARSFFCVGDQKQAIYGWRGGVAEIFEAVDQQLDGLRHESLTTTYRCAPPVVSAVNQVFQHLTQHPALQPYQGAVEQWQQRFEAHQAARVELPGYASLEGAPVQADETSAEGALDRWAVDRVSRLLEVAPTREIGILVRKNANVARLIAKLRRSGIQASEEGGNTLEDSAAVQALISLLKFADHCGDRVSAFHVLHTPLAQAIGLSDESAPSRFAASLRVREDLLSLGYGPALRQWADALRAQASPRERNRLEQLVALGYAYESRATLRTADFLRLVEAQRVPDPSSAPVRVMTIHGSKGLEFDSVLLPDLDWKLVGQPGSFVMQREDPAAPVSWVCHYLNAQAQQLLPAKLAQVFNDQQQRSIHETLCVLYVALTRAKHGLYLAIPPSNPNEKQLPKTVSGLLRAALAAGAGCEAGQMLFEQGDPEWFRRTESAPLVSPHKAPDPVATPAKIEFSKSSSSMPPLTRETPSSLEGGTMRRLQLKQGTSDPTARLRGSVMHLFFEQIRWLEEGVPEAIQLQQLGLGTLAASGWPAFPAAGEHASTKLLNSWIDEFLAALQVPALRQLLSRNDYPSSSGLPQAVSRGLTGATWQVDNERPFAIVHQGRLLSGTIDRLVLATVDGVVQAAEILDFKTDRLGDPPQPLLQERTQYYRPQLEAYREAVAHLYRLPLPAVSARLVFLEALADSVPLALPARDR